MDTAEIAGVVLTGDQTVLLHALQQWRQGTGIKIQRIRQFNDGLAIFFPQADQYQVLRVCDSPLVKVRAVHALHESGSGVQLEADLVLYSGHVHNDIARNEVEPNLLLGISLVWNSMSLNEALKIARDAKKIHIFSGAGMSQESGLEVYRDATSGLWEKVDPMAMASINAWAKDPEPMWAWYLWRAHLAQQAEPNAGHRALRDWEEKADEVWITTQNIDNLHERAGSSQITHLHGSLFHFRCSICSRPYKRVELIDEAVERLTPPDCPLCGNLIRPGVVWFGEMLPQKEWELAEQRMAECDLLVIVGTSGTVHPAASLPLIAKRKGTRILEISPQQSDLTLISDYSWRATAATALPQLVEAL